MGILIALVLLIAVGITMVLIFEYRHMGLSMTGVMIIAVMGVCLLAVLAVATIENTIHKTSYLSQYEVIRETISDSRENMNEIERAALLNKVIEINSNLATYKALSDNFWVGWYYNDRIAELEYLE